MTVGLRRPPAKPSDLNRAPTAEQGPDALREFVAVLSARLSLLWEWAQDQYLASQASLGAGGGGGGGGGAPAAEDAEILALYALMKGGC